MKHRSQYIGRIYTEIYTHRDNCKKFGLAIDKLDSVGKMCVRVIVKNSSQYINIKKFKKGDYVVVDCMEQADPSRRHKVELINMIKIDQYSEINNEIMAIRS